MTALVQRAVNGDFGARQTRVALVDVGGGGDAKESYREYHASESSTVGSRPKLTVVYGPPTSHPGLIDVPAGGDLQQALNQVQPGGTVRLASGATFVGNFTLPVKSGTALHRPDHGYVAAAGRARASTRVTVPPWRRSDRRTSIRHSPLSRARATTGSSAWRFAPTSAAPETSSRLAPTRRRRSPRCPTIWRSIASSSKATPPWDRSGPSPPTPGPRHHQLGHPRDQSGRAGFAGDCRLEYAGADHDPQQSSRSGRREHHVRRRSRSTFRVWCRATSRSRATS